MKGVKKKKPLCKLCHQYVNGLLQSQKTQTHNLQKEAALTQERFGFKKENTRTSEALWYGFVQERMKEETVRGCAADHRRRMAVTP